MPPRSRRARPGPPWPSQRLLLDLAAAAGSSRAVARPSSPSAGHPRIVLLRHATRFICPIVLFREGRLLFPSLSMLKSLRTPLILTNTFTSTGGFAGLVAMTFGGTLSWGHLSSAPGTELPVCMCHLGPHGNPRIDVSRINSKSALRPSLSWWATLRKGAAMPLQVNRGS